MHPDEARRRFLSEQVATLASVGPGQAPHIVPITFAGGGDLLYTVVDHKPKQSRQLTRLRNIAAHPTVSLLAHRYSDDWRQLWWARADGLASIEHGGSTFDAAITALAAKYPQYRHTIPPGPAIVVSVERWSGWKALAG